MGFTAENPFYAFVYHLRADWILSMISRRVKINVLFRHDKDSFEIASLVMFCCNLNCILDVFPDVRCIISIKVNDLLFQKLIW